jgi:hypothetical protein
MIRARYASIAPRVTAGPGRPSVRRMRSLVALALAFAAGCTSYSLSGGAVRSDGSVGASGIKTGYKGAGIDAGGSRALGNGDAEIGAFVTADMSGYVDDFDGDGVKWLGASVRFRRYLAGTTILAPFFALGGGPGVGGGYGDHNLVLEGYAELGVQLSLGPYAAVTLSVRERPALFIGEGPAVEPHNTLQAAFGLEIRPGGDARKRRPTEARFASRRR